MVIVEGAKKLSVALATALVDDAAPTITAAGTDATYIGAITDGVTNPYEGWTVGIFEADAEPLGLNKDELLNSAVLNAVVRK